MNLLLVEDNPGDARLVHEALRDIVTPRFDIVHATTLAGALECLSKAPLDVGLLDLDLPDSQGLTVVQQIRVAAPQMALVVLTGRSDEGLAVAALHEGAQDYIVKADVDEGSLWRALRYATERQRVQGELLSLSLVDDLTGLSNRKGFLSTATHHARLAHRLDRSFLVGFIDLDGLKQINDLFGHQEGNHALVETANVLRDTFRQCDLLARFGGDEFAVLIVDAGEAAVATVIQRVEDKVRTLNSHPHRRYQLALSIGFAASHPSQESLDIERLLHQADERMYGHKRGKRRGIF